MPWIQLRSRRDPGVWAPVAAMLLVLIPAAFFAHDWLTGWREALGELAASSPEVARAEAARGLRASSWALCLGTAAFSGFLFRYLQLGRREGRLPPAGWWAFGAWRVAVGATAERITRLGMALAALLLVASLGLALAVEWLLCTVSASPPAA